MVFRHNPGFVFHDSRGFEAGGESEFNKMKAFITDRSNIKKRLHVIWYCIPTDESARSFTEGEIKFFSQCDTGSIPVMKGTPWKDAKELALKPAERSFANGPRLGFLGGVQRPPKCHVCLPNMALDDADCGPLMERTAGTLDSGVLTQLFVSTQQTNLELCMKYAVERTLMWPVDSAETTSDEGHEKVIGKLGYWFPHLLSVSILILLRARAMLIEVIAHCSQRVSVSILEPCSPMTFEHIDPRQRWTIFNFPS
ncbi:hypothetical protein EDB19DRAFT_1670121 [Suillus lakei]|nr:hypothetical protein EDB19DRAFT_1670121 [Suillus lakei]